MTLDAIRTFLNASTPITSSLLVIGSAGLLALLTALVFRILISLQGTGTQKMEQIAAQIRSGAMAFLRREYMVIVLFALIAGGCLYIFLDTGLSYARIGQWGMPYTAGSFGLGAVCSLLAGFIGMRTATAANVRTAQAARTSLALALRVSFLSGSTMGMAVVGLGLLGLTGGLYYFLDIEHLSLAEALTPLTAFTFGASSVALFARVGGGIYTKAADVGADLVGKVEKNIPEDDPRNPAVIADNVGDNVGDVAGMGADLFESYVGSILATMLVGLHVTWTGDPGDAEIAALLPLFLAALGIVASIIGTFVVRIGKGSSNVQGALKNGMFLSSVLVLIGAYFFCQRLLPAEVSMGVFYAITSGLIAGVIIGMLTEYYTSQNYGPVRQLADSTKTGAATVMISGLALGYLSTFLPVVVVCIALAVSFSGGGMYGVAISAVGMLSTLGYSLAIDAFGPVADNAGGIAEMSKLPAQVRTRTDVLDSAGNTTAAIGKGFAIGVAGFMCLALLAAYKEEAGITGIDVSKPFTLVGILLGGMLPFLFSSMTMRAVGRAAMAMIEEVRRQFRDIEGLMEGKVLGDSARCVAISTSAAIREMILPGFLVIVAPLIVGYLLGREALGGLLVGSLVTSILMGMSMANSGGAWDNAKKFIEAGNLGGKGSDSHKAAVVGDTVGDPFKDTSGPSLNILVKLLHIIAVLTVSLFAMDGALATMF